MIRALISIASTLSLGVAPALAQSAAPPTKKPNPITSSCAQKGSARACYTKQDGHIQTHATYDGNTGKIQIRDLKTGETFTFQGAKQSQQTQRQQSQRK